MSARNRFIPLALFVAMSLAPLTAEQVKKPSRHPGDQLHYDLRVSGPEADKVVSAYFMLRLGSSSVADQDQLQSTFTTGWITRGADGSFHADLVVPAHSATGDYALTVMLRANPGTTIFRYDHADFKVAPVHIESEDQLQKPEITITERP